MISKIELSLNGNRKLVVEGHTTAPRCVTMTLVVRPGEERVIGRVEQITHDRLVDTVRDALLYANTAVPAAAEVRAIARITSEFIALWTKKKDDESVFVTADGTTDPDVVIAALLRRGHAVTSATTEDDPSGGVGGFLVTCPAWTLLLCRRGDEWQDAEAGLVSIEADD